MPTSRRKTQNPKKSHKQPQLPKVEQRRPFRTLLQSFWVRLFALVGFVASGIALFEAYQHLYPAVIFESDTSAPTQFRIQNKSSLFEMKDITLVCFIDLGAIDSNVGRLAMSFPVTSGETNIVPIESNGEAHYPCDVMNYASVSNDGGFCFLGLCNTMHSVDASSLKPAFETIRIGARYKIGSFSRDFISQPFTWDGHRWHIGATLK
jgi:hypothetical protein